MTYYNAVTEMEKMGVSDNYIQGWVAGFLFNPRIEEQRITDEYKAGYKDGQNKSDLNFSSFIIK